MEWGTLCDMYKQYIKPTPFWLEKPPNDMEMPIKIWELGLHLFE